MPKKRFGCMGYRISNILAIFSLCVAPTFVGARELSLGETLQIAREAQDLERVRPDEAIKNLKRRLLDDFGVDASCADGWWDSLDEHACWLSLQRLTRVFYKDSVDRLQDEDTAAFRIVFSNERGTRYDLADHIFTLRVFFKLPRERLREEIEYALETPAFMQARAYHAAYTRELERFRRSVSFELEFDERLTVAQRWNTVARLQRLTREVPMWIQRPTEVLRIGYRFRPMHEAHLRFEEEIDARATYATVAAHLRDVPTNKPAPMLAVRDLQSTLESEHRIEIQCSPAENLTSAECLRALAKVQAVLRMRPAFQARMKRVFILSRWEIGEPVGDFENSQDEVVLALRADFTPFDLQMYAEKKGWFR